MPKKRKGTIDPHGNQFRLRYYDAEGLRQTEIYPTEEEAERQRAMRLGELAQGIPATSEPNTVLFGELCDDVMTDYEINGYATAEDQETRFRLHIVPVFGKRRASAIKTAHIRKYIERRQAEAAANGTINRELELIRHTFIMAVNGEKLFRRPHIPMLEENNVRKGFFSEEEVGRLSAFLPHPLDKFVRFKFQTGWRYGEVVELRKTDVDLGAGDEIRIDPGEDKSRKGRVFPLTEELRELLTPLIQEKARGAFPSPYVFSVKGRKIGAFRKTWKTACHKAGIPCVVEPLLRDGKPVLDKQGKPRVKVLKALRTPHDLRRSFARHLDRKGVRRGAIKQLGGWVTDSVFNRYNIVSPTDLKDAIALIDASKRSTNGSKGQEG